MNALTKHVLKDKMDEQMNRKNQESKKVRDILEITESLSPYPLFRDGAMK